MKKLITICAVVTILLAVSGVAQATWTSVSDPLALTAINHWSLDEAFNSSTTDWTTTFADSVSGNTAELKKKSRAAKVAGFDVVNEGLQLTGVTDDLRTGVRTTTAVALPGVFAVDLYVKNLGWVTDEAQKIFGIESSQYATSNTGDVPFFVYKTTDNKIAVGINTASGSGSAATRQAIVSDSVITDSNWHRVVAGYDGENVHLYIDGTEVGTGIAYTPYKAGDPVWTGYWRMSGYAHLRSSQWTGVQAGSTNYLYAGGIDEVSVLVPEPATVALLGLGALSLIRRKKLA